MDRRDRLIEAGLVLARELSPEAVLRRIVELGVELTGARFGALGVLDARGDRLARFITVGLTAQEESAIGDPPVGRGLLGALIDDARPMRVGRIADDPRSAGFPPNHPPMTSMLGAPIVSRGTVLGNIYLTDKRDGVAFDAEDEAAVVVLATQAAIAIENARLFEAANSRAQRLEAVREVALGILGGADVEETLRTLTHRAAALVDADRAEVVLDDAAPSPGDGPLLVVPLASGGRTLGALAASRPAGATAFSPDDEEVLASFAQQAALALAYAQAQAEARRVLVLEDRERIAKELHDGVIQALFAVGMGLQGAALLTGEPELAERIEGAVTEIDRAIRDLRNYIFGLRPGALADRKLDEALHALAAEFEGRSGVVTAIDVDAGVAAELASAANDVLQLAREALSNVGRHAEATTCRLSLVRDGERAVLEVDDDGRGFDVGAATVGMGLPNLRDRARALGGELSLDAAPGRGTTVRVTLPL